LELCDSDLVSGTAVSLRLSFIARSFNMVDSVDGFSRQIGKSVKLPAKSIGVILLLVISIYFGVAWYVKGTSKRVTLKAEQHLNARNIVAARESLKWLMWFHLKYAAG